MSDQAKSQHWKPEGAPIDMRHKKAGELWDARIGQYRVQAHNWQRACFLMAVICVVLAIGLTVQSCKQSVIPYLVEVQASGEVRLVGAVTSQDWSLSESSKRVEMERWIRNLRGLSSDHRIVQERLTYVRLHSTQAAKMQLENYFDTRDPLEQFGKETRSVHIESVTQIKGSQGAYRIEWKEKVFGAKGEDLGMEAYVGEFHLSIIPPTTEEGLQINPLGVFVSFFDFDRKR